MERIKRLGLSLLVIAGLVGCGGGGGSSSVETPGSGTPGNGDSFFPSNAVLADPTPENAQKVTDLIVADQAKINSDYINTLTLNSVSNKPKLNIVLLSSNISKTLFELTKYIDIQSYSLNETVSKTIDCLQGGTMDYSMSGDEINGFNYTVAANNCVNNNVKIDGEYIATVKNRDTNTNLFKDYTIKFTTDFTVTDLSNNSMTKIFANSYMATNVISFGSFGVFKDFKVTLSVKATNGTENYGLENCILYYKNDTNSVEVYQTDGKIYINDLTSYVEYDTSYDMSQTPFVFSVDDGTLISGEARYKMANNGKLKIKVESNNEVKVYLDDGNGIFELIE